MTLLEWIDSWLMRMMACRHRDETWPVTRGRRTYRVCLDCGRERDYHLFAFARRPKRTQPPPQPRALKALAPRPIAIAKVRRPA